jgi:hypothetical protein
VRQPAAPPKPVRADDLQQVQALLALALPGQTVGSQTPGLQLVHCPASDAAGGIGCKLNREAAQ